MRIFLLLATFFLSTLAASEQSIEVLSWQPRIFYIHNFLSEDECDYLIEQARPHLRPSLVVDNESPAKERYDVNRRSEETTIAREANDPVVAAIERRISLITLIPVVHGEDLHILHYEKGGEFKPHHDYFNPRSAGGKQHMTNGGQRIASFLMYLKAPQEGGNTRFPRIGLTITPRSGDALLFYDCLVNGETDRLTLHAGEPVLAGEKWLATKWLREYPVE